MSTYVVCRRCRQEVWGSYAVIASQLCDECRQSSTTGGN